MRLQGFTQIEDNFDNENLSKLKVLNVTFTNPDASQTIGNLGLLKEVRFYEGLFYKVLEELKLEESDMVAITSTSLKELIFNLSIISAIPQQYIEFVNGNMFYTGPLRRNIHLRDEDFEFNLEDYDLEELDDLDN